MLDITDHMLSKKTERRLWVIIGWAIGLLTVYIGSVALTWIVFIWERPSFGLLTAVVFATPWLASVRTRPAGFNLAPFALGMLLNILAILVSWFLRLF